MAHAAKVIRLAQEEKIPEAIKGWMLRTACLRLLRSLNGSDASTIEYIQRTAEEERALSMEVDEHLANPCPPESGCEICDA